MIIIIILAFVIVFPLFWCFICWILSHVGGWSDIADHYSASGSAPSSSWIGAKSIRVRRSRLFAASYSGVVRMAFDDDSLYLSVFVLFRVGHEPLRISYHDMDIEVKKGILSEYLVVRTSQVPGVDILFYGKDKDRILDNFEPV